MNDKKGKNRRNLKGSNTFFFYIRCTFFQWMSTSTTFCRAIPWQFSSSIFFCSSGDGPPPTHTGLCCAPRDTTDHRALCFLRGTSWYELRRYFHTVRDSVNLWRKNKLHGTTLQRFVLQRQWKKNKDKSTSEMLTSFLKIYLRVIQNKRSQIITVDTWCIKMQRFGQFFRLSLMNIRT